MTAASTHVMVRVPRAIRQRPGRKTVVMPVQEGGEVAVTTLADPALLKAVARAFQYQRLLDEGRYGSISEMATAEKIERGHLGTLLRLTLLAPDLVEVVLDGRVADRVALPALLEPIPVVWAHQREHLLSGEPTRRAELGSRSRCDVQSYRSGSQRLAMRQATVKAGLKTFPTS